jgi:SAM-dependent methyltransferase
MKHDEPNAGEPAPDISTRWAERKFENIGSFLNTDAPKTLEDWVQPRLRDGMIARIAEVTRHRHPLSRVVDLGCGIGDWTLGYLAFAEEAVGVDINPSFVGVARQAAMAHPRGDRASFQVSALDSFEFGGRAELVCLGACTQYLDDDQLDRLLAKAAAAQERGDHLYLRSTCMHRHLKAVPHPEGYYRTMVDYERRIRAAGYEFPVARRYNSTILLAHLARRAGIPGFGFARWLTAPLNAFARLERLLLHPHDFPNWIARRV